MKKRILNNTYLSMFCTEIAMLLDAGLTVMDSIQILHDDSVETESLHVTQSLLNSLVLGTPFSTALEEAGVFPSYMINMIEVGEKSGRLVQTLEALSEHYERQTALSLTIKNSVLHPAILLIIMIAVVLVLIIQVLPIFNETYARLGTQMNQLSQNLMQLGTWLSNAAVGIAIFFSLLFAFLFVLWVVSPIRKGIAKVFFDRFGNKGIFDKISSSRFLFALTLAMTSGMDTADSINIASKVGGGGTKSVDLKHKKCTELLNSGNTLSEALFGSGILSAYESKMLAVGSLSGKSDISMAEIARRSEVNARNSIDRIVSAVEPILVIISSIVVGIILLSVMLPLMGIMTSIG